MISQCNPTHNLWFRNILSTVGEWQSIGCLLSTALTIKYASNSINEFKQTFLELPPKPFIYGYLGKTSN